MTKFRLLLALAVALLPLIRPAGPNQTALVDLVLVVLLLLAWPMFWRTRQKLRLPLIGPQWLIWIGSLIATLGSTNTLGCIVTLLQDAYIYIWFITVCNVIEPGDWLPRAWVVTALAESGLIVLGMFAGVGSLTNEWGRGVGTFINPNMASSYLVTSFFVYLAVPFPRSFLLRVAGGALILGAAVATGSNAGLAALAVGLAVVVVYWLVVERHLELLWLGVIVLAGVAFCVLVLSSATHGELAALADAGDKGGMLFLTIGRLGRGMSSRINIWGGAWQALQQYPFGLGPGVSRAGLGAELHNDFLSHLVERGVLGIIGLVWTMAAALVFLWQRVRFERERGERSSLNAAALLAGVIATLPIMLSHEVLHFRHHWLFLALIFAQSPINSTDWRRAAAWSWAWVRQPAREYLPQNPHSCRIGMPAYELRRELESGERQK